MRFTSFQIFFLCTVLIIFSGCSFFQKDGDLESESVAKVYDKYLSKAEVLAVIPSEANGKDSAKIAESYIQNWIENQVVLHRAFENIANDSLFSEIEKQIADYKNSLIRFAYEKELVSQQLDTSVTQQEIEEYYNNNKNNFELKSNIIKVIYLKLKKKSPKLNLARAWYKSDNEKDRKALDEYCHQYAENYFLDENTWLLFDDLLKEIPIKTYDKEHFLRNNRFIDIEDSDYIYLVNIKGFKIREENSPLVFERENIINTILNKRKLLLIEAMEKNAYDEALKKNDIKIFKKK